MSLIYNTSSCHTLIRWKTLTNLYLNLYALNGTTLQSQDHLNFLPCALLLLMFGHVVMMTIQSVRKSTSLDPVPTVSVSFLYISVMLCRFIRHSKTSRNLGINRASRFPTFSSLMWYLFHCSNSQEFPTYSRRLRTSSLTAMAWFQPVLFLKLIAMSGTLSHDHSTWYTVSQMRTRVAAILPDSRRRLSTAHAWPFSIQKVSPAIDVALRHVNNDRTTFEVRWVPRNCRLRLQWVGWHSHTLLSYWLIGHDVTRRYFNNHDWCSA